jgi:hypothetical protein
MKLIYSIQRKSPDGVWNYYCGTYLRKCDAMDKLKSLNSDIYRIHSSKN